MDKRLLVQTLSACAICCLAAASTSGQGLTKRVELENVIGAGQPESEASGRVAVFDGNHPSGDVPTLDVSLKNLPCRGGGRDPITEIADQLGAAFYGLYVSTAAVPTPTRLHIFNTDCST